jgi:hypothetical protein
MNSRWHIAMFGAVCLLLGGVLMQGGARSVGLLAQDQDVAKPAEGEGAPAEAPSEEAPAAPQPAAPGRLERIVAGWFQILAADETVYTEETRKFGWELFRDRLGGNDLYVLNESGAIAVTPGQKNYEMRTIGLDDNYEAIRFIPRTGEAWLFDGANWAKIEETGPTSPGDYDIHLQPAGAGKHAALRIERVTGQSWFKLGGKWNLIAEQPAEPQVEAPPAP